MPGEKKKTHGLTQLFENRDFQSLLAGIGSRVDPQGPGAMIGEPTQQMIQSQAMAEAAEEQQSQAQENLKMMILAFGGKIDYDEEGRIKSISSREGNQNLQQLAAGLGPQQEAGGLGGFGPQTPQIGDPSELGQDIVPTQGQTQPRAGTQPQADSIDNVLDNIMKSLGIGGV